MKLVIVESPTKAKTLSKLLPKGYEVKASKGHVRDLPKSGLGVDVKNNYEPEYIIPDKAKKVISSLKKDAKDKKAIVLATDPDREGEAIAWHLQYLLDKKKGAHLDFERVVFHELTQEAVAEAFSHPDEINIDLVNAQQARRVLDRLVGYKLSPLLWKKVMYGLSAGRVQSVAVRLIVEREREREAFDPKEYWTIEGLFSSQDKKNVEDFTAVLIKKDSEKVDITNEKAAKTIEKELEGVSFSVSAVKKTERKRRPSPPLKTSTLQQVAANMFGFTAKKTMRAAQKLFERGYITYHRTDSLSLAPKFVSNVRKFIEGELGKKYLPEKAIFYKTKSKGAQEAHEAIRPTHVKKVPGSFDKKLKDDEYKIYSLIWKRALESQSVPAIYDRTTIFVGSDNNYVFKATGSIIKFDGWLKVGKFIGFEAKKDSLDKLPALNEKDSLVLKNLALDQHFTQPPARYSDATLIKTLEELGVGRPSTYAPTLSTIQARRYVVKDGRYFVPQDVAFVVTDLLVKHFPNVVDYEFTASMEKDLDKIAAGKEDWVGVIDSFYDPFEKVLDKKDKELQKSDVTTLAITEEKCPECGKNLVVKLGKYGKFLSCSGYPDCKYAQPLKEDKVFDEDGNEITDFGRCDKCEDGVMVLKKGRFGKFLACNNYPKCKNTKPYLEKIGVKCPECKKGDVVIKKAKKRTFYGCSRYPECEYSSWKKPEGEPT